MKIQRIFYELNFNRNSLEIRGTLEFDEIWPPNFLLHLVPRKNEFQVNIGQEFEFPLKVEFRLIYQ
jgi:hypothetical protein